MKFPEETAKEEQGGHLAEYILGGQDGLVNVMSLVLGVASATNDTRLVIISGLVGLAAETISMGAVAYTSTRAAQDFYHSEVAREEEHIKTREVQERRFLQHVYEKKGFRGRLLHQIIAKITGNKRVWLKEIVNEEIGPAERVEHPMRSALTVGVATLVGSIIPLIPFFFLSVRTSIVVSLIAGMIILFGVGYWKSKLTVGVAWKNGLEMALIGTFAALVGYGIGKLL